MTLPRFTSGKVGALEFSHLNEVFDRIEDSSALVTMKRPRAALGRVFLAKILSKTGSGLTEKGAFEEVARVDLSAGTYAVIPGGLRSTLGSDAYRYPIVAAVSGVGSIVPILGHIAGDGSLYFKECAVTGSSSTGTMASVASATGTAPRWTYALNPVKWNGSAWVATGAAQIAGAINGAENAVDTPATRNIGVGSVYVANATATRNPIKVGTVVGPVIDIDGFYLFSTPNGYTFACA